MVDIGSGVGSSMQLPDQQPTEQKIPVCLQYKGKKLVDLLGKSYVLELLYYLSSNHPEAIRFNKLKKELSITATTLSRRLEELIEVGLVKREVFAEVPARVEYSKTEKGQSFGPVLKKLFTWVEENK